MTSGWVSLELKLVISEGYIARVYHRAHLQKTWQGVTNTINPYFRWLFRFWQMLCQTSGFDFISVYRLRFRKSNFDANSNVLVVDVCWQGQPFIIAMSLYWISWFGSSKGSLLTKPMLTYCQLGSGELTFNKTQWCQLALLCLETSSQNCHSSICKTNLDRVALEESS